MLISSTLGAAMNNVINGFPKFSPDFLDELPKLRSGPFWAELRLFLAVARSGSYSRATELVNCSQPTVGRAVRRLEDVLGVRLVIPNTRGITLTEIGRQLAYSLLKLDRELHEISSAIKGKQSKCSGSAVISCPEAICGFFIAPALPVFSQLYPDITTNFISRKTLNALKNNDYDILISTARHSGSEYKICCGGYINFVPMASIEYLKQYGMPT